MLISIDRNARAHQAILDCGKFCVNILGMEQAELISLFSNSDLRDKRFEHESWRIHESLPYLVTAASNIFCHVRQTIVFGTHEIFIERFST